MKKKIKNHLGYYITFTIIQILGFVLILMTAGNRQLQLTSIFATTIFYVIFALIHHYLDHDLSAKIVVEYALMGCLGLTVSLIVFNI